MTYRTLLQEIRENRKYMDEDHIVAWGEFRGRRVSDMSYIEMLKFKKCYYYQSRNKYFHIWFKRVYREKSPNIDNFWNEFEKYEEDLDISW